MAKTKFRWTLNRFETVLLSAVTCAWGGLRPPKYTVEEEKVKTYRVNGKTIKTGQNKFHIMMGLPQMAGITVAKSEFGNCSYPLVDHLINRCAQRMCVGWKQRATELIGKYPDKEWYEHVSAVIRIMGRLKKKHKKNCGKKRSIIIPLWEPVGMPADLRMRGYGKDKRRKS